jgi:hypothetical protein
MGLKDFFDRIRKPGSTPPEGEAPLGEPFNWEPTGLGTAPADGGPGGSPRADTAPAGSWRRTPSDSRVPQPQAPAPSRPTFGGPAAGASRPASPAAPTPAAAAAPAPTPQPVPPVAPLPALAPVPTVVGAAIPADTADFGKVYNVAGVQAPAHGYGIDRVAQMLNHRSLAGLDKQVKASAVLAALDAAGVPVQDLVQDAFVRYKALLAFEAAKDLETATVRPRSLRRIEELKRDIEEFQKRKNAEMDALTRQTNTAIQALFRLKNRARGEEDRMYRAVALFVESLPARVLPMGPKPVELKLPVAEPKPGPKLVVPAPEAAAAVAAPPAAAPPTPPATAAVPSPAPAMEAPAKLEAAAAPSPAPAAPPATQATLVLEPVAPAPQPAAPRPAPAASSAADATLVLPPAAPAPASDVPAPAAQAPPSPEPAPPKAEAAAEPAAEAPKPHEGEGGKG